MSNYSKVLSRFWTGETGRALRGDPEAQLVAAYVITSPHSNMLGFYYLPRSYIANDTGIDIEGVSKALARLEEAGYCRYDERAEVIWVIEMARIQVGESLEPKDKRVIAIRREYESMPNNRFLKEFFQHYGSAFNISNAREFKDPSQGACKAPSKPATAAATTAATTTATAPAAASIPAASRRAADNGQGRTVDTWTSYASAYRDRWGVEPTRNKQVNSQLAKFLERVPIEEAPQIAAFYVQSKRGLYTSAKHPVTLLLRDAEALRTEWLTGRHGTDTEARQGDRTGATSNAFQALLDESQSERKAA